MRNWFFFWGGGGGGGEGGEWEREGTLERSSTGL